jgi:hypothetical protein
MINQIMRKASVLIIAGSLLFLASCHKDAGTFTIKFQPKFGSADLKLNTTYSTPDGKYLSFSSFGMYLSHIKLVKTDNSTVEVDSAVLFVYADNSYMMNLKAVNGSYKGIQFGIGLDSAQNRISPANVPSNDPVYYNNALWWDVPRYHLFTQMEGHSGTTSSLNSIFFYHVGTDSVYRSAYVTKSFSIADGQATSLVLNTDLRQIFYGANAVNVFTDPATHSTDYPAVAKTVADAFTQSFSIQ